MKILLVEDEDSILRVFEMILSIENHEVQTAKNGLEALGALRRLPLPDLILLDLMMPVMDGWEFLSKKNDDPRISAIPTIVISAFVDKIDSIQAQGFIKKPFDITEVLQVLKKFETKT